MAQKMWYKMAQKMWYNLIDDENDGFYINYIIGGII